MGKAKDITGQRFGQLVALRVVGAYRRERAWLCQCDCGGLSTVSVSNLVSGNTTTCGHGKGFRSEHGMTGTRTHRCWGNMKARCLNPRVPNFKRYGGRGITVCERWLTFENFLEDMGECPEGQTLERKDNSKGYEPDNCRWATPKEQAANRRTNVLVDFEGERIPLAEVSRRSGVPFSTLRYRHGRGYPLFDRRIGR